MFLPVSFGVMMTIWLVWVDLCIVLPVAPYAQLGMLDGERLRSANPQKTGPL